MASGDTARGALQAGNSSSDLRCLILRDSGTVESDDVGDPVPEVRLRLAVHLASAQARMVKYQRSLMKVPRRDACASHSPNTR